MKEKVQMKMSEDFFRNAIKCLKQLNVNFWLERGTLLGFIREGKPIPWDRDFDIGLWNHEVEKRKIINTFVENGFFVLSLFPFGIEGIHVFPNQNQNYEKIDLIFYTMKNDRARHCSVVLKRTVKTRLIESIELYFDPRYRAKQPIKRFIEILYHDKISPLLPDRFKKFKLYIMNRLILKKYTRGASLTYDFPAEYFLNLKSAKFLGVDVRIPENSEGYISEAYGTDWRIPKRWKHWSEGATFINGQKNVALMD